MFPKVGLKHNSSLLIFKWALEYIYKPQAVMHLKRLGSKYLSTIHLFVTEQKRSSNKVNEPIYRAIFWATNLVAANILGPLFILSC